MLIRPKNNRVAVNCDRVVPENLLPQKLWSKRAGTGFKPSKNVSKV